MSERPFPIEPPSSTELNAGWARVRAGLEKRRRRFSIPWLIFFSCTAAAGTATVVATQLPDEPKRLVVAAERAEPPAQEQPAEVQTPEVAVAPPPRPHVKSDVASKPLGSAPAIDDDFVLGSNARRAGDFSTALRYFTSFATQHEDDARAALAASEASRILAEDQSRSGEALSWSERAIRLSQRGPIREDARARVVQLLDTLGRIEACSSARDQFLHDYPTSIHTQNVRRACQAPQP